MMLSNLTEDIHSRSRIEGVTLHALSRTRLKHQSTILLLVWNYYLQVAGRTVIVLAVLKSTVDWTVTVVTVLGMLDVKVDVPDELVWSGSVLVRSLALSSYFDLSDLTRQVLAVSHLVEDGTGPDTTVVRGPIVEVTVTVSMAAL